MSESIKNQSEILAKLGITQLNPMQEEALQLIPINTDIVLLSPTGTGKTLAFLLPILAELKSDIDEVQALIVVPSRELAIQIETVIRGMGAGYKVNAVYGGRAGSQDKIDLQHRPAILIGTPGRIADHLRKKSFPSEFIKTLVLDEFDKSLQIGFEAEMMELTAALHKVKKRILTSATQGVEIPKFVKLKNPVHIDYLDSGDSQLDIKTILSPKEDKLPTLVETIRHQGNERGIIFCNLKESIQEVCDALIKNRISHGVFHGGLEQIDRERALIKFRNGTHQILVATDLAARGIDVPEIRFIIHYQLPRKEDEFTHRNGRTARMNKDGSAFIIKSSNEEMPDYYVETRATQLQSGKAAQVQQWKTLHISGGRKDKISKGDIAGLFLKQGQLGQNELGMIELKQDCSYVAVDASKVNALIKLVDNSKLKTKKVRISLI